MGIFDRFRKRKPTRQLTREQAERLYRIRNPQQLQALLRAIDQGEDIADHAWEPLPENLDTVAVRRQFREHLRAAEAAEPARPGIPAEISGCAQTLRATATAASGYLGAPVECPALGSADAFTPLLAWAYFNPFGPTLCSLHLVEVPDTRERIIFFRWLNPFATGATAYGLLPEAVAQDAQRVLSILMPLLRDGSDDRPRLMASLPTHVRVLAESPLAERQVKELVLAAATGSDASALSVTIHSLRTHQGDPWARTAVETKEAFASLGQDMESSSEAMAPPATRAQLEDWWALVTDPAHVQSEVRELPRAWQGAVEFQKRMR